MDARAFGRLCRARDLLRQIDRARTIDEVAREVAISRAHFIRLFEALFGTTPHQFRIDARLDLAKALLAAGERSVTDVCLDVGFSSLGSFSALFTRRVGVPPSAYRRLQRRPIVLTGTGAATSTATARLLSSGHSCFALMGLVPAGVALFEKHDRH